VLVAIGRRPTPRPQYRQGDRLELNARGQIETDHDFRTKSMASGRSAMSIPGPMLAHKAEDEGIAVAEYIAGIGIVNHAVIPGWSIPTPKSPASA
jgi:dihydrolipoamide dehydrogenase